MQSFFQFINEAYSTDMKNVFTSNQLSKIGAFFNKKLNVSVQDSTFKHYTNKNFKVKYAVENSYVVCKMLDGIFVIVEVINQRNYKVVYCEDSARHFADVMKNVIWDTTDFFVFDMRANVDKDLRTQRNNNKIVTDKLLQKQGIIDKKKLLQNDYVKSLNSQLRKYKIGFADLCIVTHSGGQSELALHKQWLGENKYVNIYIKDYYSAYEKVNSIDFKVQPISSDLKDLSEIDNYIEELKSAREASMILKKIDFNKLPHFTYDEYRDILDK